MVEPVVPFVSAEEVAVVAETDAVEAVSDSVTLTIGGSDVTVEPEQSMPTVLATWEMASLKQAE